MKKLIKEDKHRIRNKSMELEKPRSIVVLTTAKGVRLNAIWKEKKDRWYIVESEDRRISNIGILNTLTPRQFQDAIDKGEYSFEW
ncbi:MAG: hypothetical protein ACRD8W_20935 [Nitrososphaeraceae archaeon]